VLKESLNTVFRPGLCVLNSITFRKPELLLSSSGTGIFPKSFFRISQAQLLNWLVSTEVGFRIAQPM